ncbi:MAG: hypothetical protein ABIN58_12355, partial [candidate division WOR-3 bacterium]
MQRIEKYLSAERFAGAFIYIEGIGSGEMSHLRHRSNWPPAAYRCGSGYDIIGTPYYIIGSGSANVHALFAKKVTPRCQNLRRE